MEVKRDEMTQEIYDEWSTLIREQECAFCGAQLTIKTIPERGTLTLSCPHPGHTGFRQRTSYTQEYRRGAVLLPPIQDNIERHLIEKAGFNRAMNLLAMRFPDSIKDTAGASLFINDCMRLGLDPLIQPAEAVPITFKSKDKMGKEKVTVAMVVTEDGALSMAARGCPEEYDGSPATMPLLDYLMREHPQRSYEDLQDMTRRTAAELCGDEGAYVWVALGKRRSATSIQPVYGYFTQAERKKAQGYGLPAGSQPGNQARVRAIKRWVRENFPESRQKMLEYTADFYSRSEGAKAAQEFIDAEYTLITGPLIGKEDKKTTDPGGKKAEKPTAKQKGNKVSETAQRLPADGGGDDQITSEGASGADEVTVLHEHGSTEPFIANDVPAVEPSIEGEGFNIALDWLNDTLKLIKWSEDTAKSWIAGNLKADTQGKLTEVLARLSRENAEKFVHELQERAARIQPELFP